MPKKTPNVTARLIERIKKLEGDINLLNARIRSLEIQPHYVITWPALPAPSPAAPFQHPYIGDAPAAPFQHPYIGDAPNSTISGTFTINGKSFELFKAQQ